MTISKEVKVGLFVLVGMIVLGAVVFLIGDQRHMFERKIDFRTTFTDVQGLSEGAPVRMDGINVGTVSRVGHAEDLGDPRIHVHFWIVASEARRIRKDGKALIANKGLLGDKMLEVTPGSPDQPQVQEDDFIEGVDPTDLSNLARQAGTIAERAASVLTNIDKATESFANEQFQQDVRSSAHSINVILKNVAEGDGYANRFLTDPAEAESLSRAVRGFDQTSGELAIAAKEMRMLTQRINRGPGFAHSLVYSRDGEETVKQFGRAAGEVATTLEGIRESDSLAHALIYGGEGEEKDLVRNLNAASADIREITAGLRSGKGTLGALLVDPSVYEDLKVLLGNVERNEVLRSLVRYSIKKDESKPAVEVSEPRAR